MSESAARLVTERDALVDRILSRLNATPPEREKVSLVRALGQLGSPKAVDYLLKDHEFTLYPVIIGEIDTLELPRYPCLEALAEIGPAAVPRMVEAYITWPAERWPDGFYWAFRHNRTVARAAYIYAQGFLFANKENGHHRDAVLNLIRDLGPDAAEGLPFPPPWMAPPEVGPLREMKRP